ncbi:MAG: type II secretion system protein [Candidatus Paceibacterota bacterium]|jgi:prepilin-type N-terminal cleavage/methylation domain-containing protein
MSFYSKKKKNICFQKGMTYVELIVVLSIFGAITSVVLFSYGDFQEKVDIRNLGNQIALKIVEAQKKAVVGQGTVQSVASSWKPSYGVAFSMAGDHGLNNKSFAYFADLDNDKSFNDTSCVLPVTSESGECLDKIEITKGNIIQEMNIFYQDESYETVPNLSVIFTRPDSGAIITGGSYTESPLTYVRITISSPNNILDFIKVYPSGRIELE